MGHFDPHFRIILAKNFWKYHIYALAEVFLSDLHFVSQKYFSNSIFWPKICQNWGQNGPFWPNFGLKRLKFQSGLLFFYPLKVGPPPYENKRQFHHFCWKFTWTIPNFERKFNLRENVSDFRMKCRSMGLLGLWISGKLWIAFVPVKFEVFAFGTHTFYVLREKKLLRYVIEKNGYAPTLTFGVPKRSRKLQKSRKWPIKGVLF